MSKTKKQKMELLYRICKALSPLYGELEDEKLRNLLLNTMIDVSDKQFGTALRKKLSSQQSKSSDKIKR